MSERMRPASTLFTLCAVVGACATGVTEIDRAGLTTAATSGGGTTSAVGVGGGSAGGGSVGGSGGGSETASSSASATTTSTANATGATSATSGAGGASSSAVSSSSSGVGGSNLVLPGDWIDDLEDGNGAILVQGGRQGGWYTYNDGTAMGKQSPPEGGTFIPIIGGHNSQYAAATKGSGFIGWGAGFGFDFNNTGVDALTRMPYDLSNFTGVLFWIRGTTAQLRVSVQTTDVVPVSEGGSCGQLCNDYHGVPINVTSSWTEHVIPLNSLQQEGWGTAEVFVPQNVISVVFQTAAAVVFDHEVDDIGLY